MQMHFCAYGKQCEDCKYRKRRRHCAFGNCASACLSTRWMRDGAQPQSVDVEWRSVMMPHIGWLTRGFSIVDLSQSHRDPGLPVLFIYPCLFLSSFKLSVLVWVGWTLKMGGWERCVCAHARVCVCALTLSMYLATLCTSSIPVCVFHLLNFSLCSQNLKIHNRDLHPTWS